MFFIEDEARQLVDCIMDEIITKPEMEHLKVKGIGDLSTISSCNFGLP